MPQAKSSQEVWKDLADDWSTDEAEKSRQFVQHHKPFTIAMEKWLPLEKGMRVVEPGCGFGIFAASMAQRAGTRAMCVDFVPDILQLAQRNFKEAGVEGDFVQADIRYMPFKKGSFDVVFNQGVIEHFAMPDRQLVVDEMARISRKYVSIFVPNSLNPFRAVAKRIQMLQGRWKFGLEMPYSPWELKHRLEKAGVKVVRREGVNFFKIFYTYWPFRVILYPLLLRLLGERLYRLNAADIFLNRFFGDELYALAVKDVGVDKR